MVTGERDGVGYPALVGWWDISKEQASEATLVCPFQQNEPFLSVNVHLPQWQTKCIVSIHVNQVPSTSLIRARQSPTSTPWAM